MPHNVPNGGCLKHAIGVVSGYVVFIEGWFLHSLHREVGSRYVRSC